MFTVDQFRFGTFHYKSYDQVNDYHLEFCLPQKATDITVQKDGAGHLARYTIAEKDMREFLDATWKDHGIYAVTPREQLSDEGRIAREEEYWRFVERLKWRPLKDAIKLSGPRSARGGGVTYFFEPSTNTVYHDAGYW